jgi:hypothetical protein
MRWQVHGLRSNLIKNQYNIVLPSTPWSSNESLYFRVPHYNTLTPCARYLEDKKLTRYHVCIFTSTHRLNTQLPPGFVAEKHVVMQGSSCNLYFFISKQSFTTEPRAKAQFIKWRFRRGGGGKPSNVCAPWSSPRRPGSCSQSASVPLFLRQLRIILSMIINR